MNGEARLKAWAITLGVTAAVGGACVVGAIFLNKKLLIAAPFAALLAGGATMGGITFTAKKSWLDKGLDKLGTGKGEIEDETHALGRKIEAGYYQVFGRPNEADRGFLEVAGEYIFGSNHQFRDRMDGAKREALEAEEMAAAKARARERTAKYRETHNAMVAKYAPHRQKLGN